MNNVLWETQQGYLKFNKETSLGLGRPQFRNNISSDL